MPSFAAMGPSRLFHKDRSQPSLLNTQDANDRRQYYSSPRESPLHSPGLPPPSAQPTHDDEIINNNGDDEEQDDHRGGQSHHIPYRSEEAQYYQQVHTHQPTRSLSQRSPGPINTSHPTIHLVRPGSGAASTPASAIEPEEPDQYYYQRAEPAPAPQKEDRRQKRRFFGLGSSKESSGAPATRLGRSRSIRGKEQYPDVLPEGQRPVQQHQQHQQFQQGQQQQPQHHHQQQQLYQHHNKHHLWGGHVSPTDEDEGEDGGGAGLHTPYHQRGNSPPGLPDKDPLRSPGFPPPITAQEYNHAKGGSQSSHQGRHPLDRQGSHPSPWERAAYQIQQQTPSDSASGIAHHPSPISANSATGYHQKTLPENPHTYSQDQDSRPSSRQSLDQTLSTTSHPYSHHTRASSSQASSVSHMPLPMGPGQIQPPAPSRRSSEAQQAGQSRDQPSYQPYSQGSVISGNPPQYSSQLAPQPQTYRTNTQASPMQAGEQGRSTPPPSRSRDDLTGLDVASLLGRHDELQDKYRKVKKYYFDKDAQVQQLQGQVQQLQNALAHQRLSLSRTSLDDNEYSNRFNRLDGAINNLAFNLRREWRSIPPWLAPHVNRDALTQPTKEMTAVGRATISRWLVEEVLDRYFHPAIEPGFSSQLKVVEKNLRRYTGQIVSEEEKDSLLSKISTWRLSTLDGLHENMSAAQGGEYRATLTDFLVDKLIASLCVNLKDPPPPGLEGSVSMIIELAVGIACNIPVESRDVFVEYITPGQLINDTYMKVETGLPILTNPGEGPIDPADIGSLMLKHNKGEDTGSIDSRDTGTSNGNGSDDMPPPSRPSDLNQQGSSQGQQGQSAPGVGAKGDGPGGQVQAQAPKKKGMFGSFIGGGGSSGSNQNSGGVGNIIGKKGGGITGGNAQQQQQQQGGPQGGQSPPGQVGQQQQQQQHGGQIGAPPGAGQEKKEDRVRFSTFMAVEVRGRNVLVRAPVYLRD